MLERDTDLRRTIGHGLQLGAPAMTALHEMLPADALRGLYAVAQGTWVETGYTVIDHKARVLTRTGSDGDPDGVATDRVTLRLLLADGLGPHLRLGTEVTGHRTRDDGRVVATTSDGEEVVGDVLIAADGVSSSITQTLAGRPTARPTALLGFAGRTPAHAVPEPLVELLGDGATIAAGPRGTSLYVGHHGALDQEVVRSFTPYELHPEPTYVWGAVMLEWAQTTPMLQLRGEELRAAVASELAQRGWAEDLTSVVARAERDSVTPARFYAAPTYEAGIAPWSASRVTAIGDAVHAMPPTGGRGATTAIRDAHLLYQQLLAARDGHVSVVEAVQTYEGQMRGYAAQVVAEALRPPSWSPSTAHTPTWSPPPRRLGTAGAAVSWAQHRTDPEPELASA